MIIKRLNFHTEARLMSHLKDVNIVRILGACTVGEPRCLLVEYLEHGKLDEYLKQYTLEGTTTTTLNNTKTIRWVL